MLHYPLQESERERERATERRMLEVFLSKRDVCYEERDVCKIRFFGVKVFTGNRLF